MAYLVFILIHGRDVLLMVSQCLAYVSETENVRELYRLAIGAVNRAVCLGAATDLVTAYYKFFIGELTKLVDQQSA